MNPQNRQKTRNTLLGVLGVVALAAAVYVFAWPMLNLGQPDTFKKVAMNVDQPAEAPAGGEEALPDGSASVRAAPSSSRRDPFRPLAEPKPAAATPPAAPAAGQPSGGGRDVISQPVPVLPGGIGEAAAPGVPAFGPLGVPQVSQPKTPQGPQDPIVMLGTAMGSEALVLFRRGNEILERRAGDYLGPYRITAIDHGRIQLIDAAKNSPTMEPGQALLPSGAPPVRLDPMPNSGGGHNGYAPPREAGVMSIPEHRTPAAPSVQVSDARWPSTVR